MKKLLITGATGFIGRACVSVLNNSPDYEIHAISRKKLNQSNISWHLCDLLNFDETKSLIETLKPDFLIHLAWYVEFQDYLHSMQNYDYINATVNLYKQFSINGGKNAVLAGTCAEYDSSLENPDEHAHLNPNTNYGKAKKQTYELISELYKKNSTYASFIWTRLFNLFGPYEDLNRLFPYIISNYLAKQIPQIKNPNVIRDYTFVENLAETLVALLKANCSGAINIGSGDIYSLAEINDIIRQKLFQMPSLLQNPMLNSIERSRFVPNLKKLQQLNIKPIVSFEEGLKKTYEWIHNSHYGAIYANNN